MLHRECNIASAYGFVLILPLSVIKTVKASPEAYGLAFLKTQNRGYAVHDSARAPIARFGIPVTAVRQYEYFVEAPSYM